MSIGCHIRIRLEDDRVIAPTPAERRALARVTLAIGEPFRLLAFRAADTHAHVEAACSVEDGYELARRIEIALHYRLKLEVPFQRARVKPIADQWHLYNTFDYTFRQERHHGTDSDPLFEASNLPDLLGLRRLGDASAESVRMLLPRVRRERLLDHLGGPDLDAAAASVDALGDSAAAAFALPHLGGRGIELARARLAAVHAIGDAAPTPSIAAALEIGDRGVRALAAKQAPAEDVRAVTLQLRLRSWWSTHRADRRVEPKP